jgi:hypothetical protein
MDHSKNQTPRCPEFLVHWSVHSAENYNLAASGTYPVGELDNHLIAPDDNAAHPLRATASVKRPVRLDRSAILVCTQPLILPDIDHSPSSRLNLRFIAIDLADFLQEYHTTFK